MFTGSAPVKMFFRHLRVHNRERTYEDEVVWQELQNLDEWTSFDRSHLDGFEHTRLNLYMIDHWKAGPRIMLRDMEARPLYTNEEEHVWKLWKDLQNREANKKAKNEFENYRKNALSLPSAASPVRDATPYEIIKKREEKLKEVEVEAKHRYYDNGTGRELDTVEYRRHCYPNTWYK